MIPILMTVFAIGGTTFGMAEESLAFYVLVITVMIAAGYDALTGALVILSGLSASACWARRSTRFADRHRVRLRRRLAQRRHSGCVWSSWSSASRRASGSSFATPSACEAIRRPRSSTT